MQTNPTSEVAIAVNGDAKPLVGSLVSSQDNPTDEKKPLKSIMRTGSKAYLGSSTGDLKAIAPEVDYTPKTMDRRVSWTDMKPGHKLTKVHMIESHVHPLRKFLRQNFIGVVCTASAVLLVVVVVVVVVVVNGW